MDVQKKMKVLVDEWMSGKNDVDGWKMFIDRWMNG